MCALLGEGGGVVLRVLGNGEGAEGVVDLGCHWVVAGEVGGEVVDVVLVEC